MLRGWGHRSYSCASCLGHWPTQSSRGDRQPEAASLRRSTRVRPFSGQENERATFRLRKRVRCQSAKDMSTAHSQLSTPSSLPSLLMSKHLFPESFTFAFSGCRPCALWQYQTLLCSLSTGVPSIALIGMIVNGCLGFCVLDNQHYGLSVSLIAFLFHIVSSLVCLRSLIVCAQFYQEVSHPLPESTRLAGDLPANKTLAIRVLLASSSSDSTSTSCGGSHDMLLLVLAPPSMLRMLRSEQ